MLITLDLSKKTIILHSNININELLELIEKLKLNDFKIIPATNTIEIHKMVEKPYITKPYIPLPSFPKFPFDPIIYKVTCNG